MQEEIEEILNQLITDLELKEKEYPLIRTIHAISLLKVIRDIIQPSPPVEQTVDAGPFFITKFDSNKYYWCKCENCGWEDSSEFTEGCHAIADTGDHTDPVCPICIGNSLEADSSINPDKQYEGIVDVKIPYSIIIDAYKKTISQLNDSLDNFRYPES